MNMAKSFFLLSLLKIRMTEYSGGIFNDDLIRQASGIRLLPVPSKNRQICTFKSKWRIPRQIGVGYFGHTFGSFILMGSFIG